MSIKNLISDIQEKIKSKDGWFTDALATDFAREVSLRLQEQLNATHTKGRLRLSQMGPRCPKALWNSVHHPELAEALPAWAEVKFSIGHIHEAFAITLMKAAGHNVVGEQDELVLDDIVGHRDCVVDGCIFDVKSASSLSYEKFKTGSIRDNDPFGYLEQLDAYVVASRDDPLVTVKDRGYLLAFDKTLGHMCIYEHLVREAHIRERIREYKDIVKRDTPPSCTCGTRPHGKSGNIGLDTKAKYNVFKHSCFDGKERPRIRTFLYSSGPEYLIDVQRKPDVTEVDHTGKVVYN